MLPFRPRFSRPAPAPFFRQFGPSLFLLWLASAPPAGANEHGQLACRHCAAQVAAAAPDQPGFRKYPPDRTVDIQHLKLEVVPDFTNHTLTGTATLRFQPIAKPLRELRLDAENLTIREVSATVPVQEHHADRERLTITFRDEIPAGRETEIVVRYRAEPREGMYFRTPRNGYAAADTHLWTQGEPQEARHWFPVHDFPNEKFTSEIVCHVPEGMVVLSNGREVSREKRDHGLVAHRWLQDKPHTAYLITLVAGYFQKLEDRHGNVPLTFWTTAGELKEAPNSFRHTRNMMAFFEREIGVPYPWDQYGQVCVHGFMWGGMENTGMTTLNRYTLFSADTENVFSSDGLVAHELAHQWFGDLVTCKEWSDIWLNEGFATYYDALWHGHFFGADELNHALYQNASRVLGQTNESRGIVWREYDVPKDMFNYLAYPKGAWVLHMLRAQLGPDLFRRCIKTYLERHRFGTVETADLRAVVEELSGRSWSRFFDQWVYQVGTPALEVAHQWDAKTKLARVTVRQTQKIAREHPLFQFPLTLRFKSKDGTTDRTVQVREKEEQFFVPLAAAPEIVRVDPDYTLLARVNFKRPNAMLHAQLADATDMMGRLLAANELAGKKDLETVERLRVALNGDAHHAVRTAAAQALRKIHTDEALRALLASTTQTDARVRKAVTDAIGGFYNAAARDGLLKLLAAEKNPAIRAGALAELGRHDAPTVKTGILTALKTKSFRERLAEGAVNAIRNQDSPAYIAPLLDTLSTREKDFPDRVFATALDTLAFIARHESGKDRVRQFLVAHLNHPLESLKLAAIRALGVLEDPRAIPQLETFANAAGKTPGQQAAEKAIAQLRDAKKPSEDLRKLRQELLDLQKSNRDLKKEFEDLKKRLEAKPR